MKKKPSPEYFKTFLYFGALVFIPSWIGTATYYCFKSTKKFLGQCAIWWRIGIEFCIGLHGHHDFSKCHLQRQFGCGSGNRPAIWLCFGKK